MAHKKHFGKPIDLHKTLYYLISEIIFLLGKHLVLQIFTTKSHMWFCLT